MSNEDIETTAAAAEETVAEAAYEEPTAETADIVSVDDEDLDSEDSLTFSNGVIEKIVAIAMRDVPGVIGMKGGFINRVQETFGAVDPRKGVTVEVTPDSAVRVNISVMIEYGAYAPQVFEDVKSSPPRLSPSPRRRTPRRPSSRPRRKSEPAYLIRRRPRQADQLGPPPRAAPQRVPAAGPRRPGHRPARALRVGGQGRPRLHRGLRYQRQDDHQQRPRVRRRGERRQGAVQPGRRQHGPGRDGGDAAGTLR